MILNAAKYKSPSPQNPKRRQTEKPTRSGHEKKRKGRTK